MLCFIRHTRHQFYHRQSKNNKTCVWMESKHRYMNGFMCHIHLNEYWRSNTTHIALVIIIIIWQKCSFISMWYASSHTDTHLRTFLSSLSHKKNLLFFFLNFLHHHHRLIIIFFFFFPPSTYFFFSLRWNFHYVQFKKSHKNVSNDNS